jgi:hypothetical protein
MGCTACAAESVVARLRPLADSPELPYGFDLLHDIKTEGQLVREWNQAKAKIDSLAWLMHNNDLRLEGLKI